jgi:GNAT superfamily N-acetyltransferase
MPGLEIRSLALPCAGLDLLRLEAATEGLRFLERLVADWDNGGNRFDRPGERFAGAFIGEYLVAVGGLGHDPYIEAATTGRLRHLYVLSAYRRCGVGSALVADLLRHAGGVFTLVRLRTDREQAARFYARLGFHAVADPTASHSRPV